MYITIDFQSEIPIYQQVKDSIIIGIATGQLKPGENLPTIRQIASELGVNLHTINKAYNQLKSEGYITVDRRKGTTILPIPTKITDDSLELIRKNLLLTLSNARCRGLSDDDLLSLITETLNYIDGRHENG